jgi:hypothetical protein
MAIDHWKTRHSCLGNFLVKYKTTTWRLHEIWALYLAFGEMLMLDYFWTFQFNVSRISN